MYLIVLSTGITVNDVEYYFADLSIGASSFNNTAFNGNVFNGSLLLDNTIQTYYDDYDISISGTISFSESNTSDKNLLHDLFYSVPGDGG
mgnify:CR=1 FL=1